LAVGFLKLGGYVGVMKRRRPHPTCARSSDGVKTAVVAAAVALSAWPFASVEESSSISSLSGVKGSLWRRWRSTSVVSQLLSCSQEQNYKQAAESQDAENRHDIARGSP